MQLRILFGAICTTFRPLVENLIPYAHHAKGEILRNNGPRSEYFTRSLHIPSPLSLSKLPNCLLEYYHSQNQLILKNTHESQDTIYECIEPHFSFPQSCSHHKYHMSIAITNGASHQKRNTSLPRTDHILWNATTGIQTSLSHHDLTNIIVT